MEILKQIRVNETDIKYRYNRIHVSLDEINKCRNQLIIVPGDRCCVPTEFLNSCITFDYGIDCPNLVVLLEGVKWSSIYTMGLSVEQLKDHVELYNLIKSNCLDDIDIIELIVDTKSAA